MASVSDSCPREPSVSWSMRAESGMGDSPGRVSANGQQSNRTVNVSRGDSLAYSDDSQDNQNLLQSRGSSTIQKNSSVSQTPMKQLTAENISKPANHGVRATRSSGFDSMASEDSLQEASKRACCVIQ